MNRPDYLVQGEAARLFPVLATTSKEGRTTSILLGCISKIDEFGAALLESDSKLFERIHCLASSRVTRRMCAIVTQAAALAIDFSQSFDRRRHLPSQARVRSTTHRRGKTSNPSAVSERLTICSAQCPIDFNVSLNFGPAYPPSAKPWRSVGYRAATRFRTSGAPSRSWMAAL